MLILVNLCLAYTVTLFPFTASLLHIGPETGDAAPDTSESEMIAWDGDLGEVLSGGGRDVRCKSPRAAETIMMHALPASLGTAEVGGPT